MGAGFFRQTNSKAQEILCVFPSILRKYDGKRLVSAPAFRVILSFPKKVNNKERTPESPLWFNHSYGMIIPYKV